MKSPTPQEVRAFVQRIFHDHSITTVEDDDASSAAYELVRHYPQLTGHLENHEVSGKTADQLIDFILDKLGLSEEGGQ